MLPPRTLWLARRAGSQSRRTLPRRILRAVVPHLPALVSAVPRAQAGRRRPPRRASRRPRRPTRPPREKPLRAGPKSARLGPLTLWFADPRTPSGVTRELSWRLPEQPGGGTSVPPAGAAYQPGVHRGRQVVHTANHIGGSPGACLAERRAWHWLVSPILRGAPTRQRPGVYLAGALLNDLAPHGGEAGPLGEARCRDLCDCAWERSPSRSSPVPEVVAGREGGLRNGPISMRPCVQIR